MPPFDGPCRWERNLPIHSQKGAKLRLGQGEEPGARRLVEEISIGHNQKCREKEGPEVELGGWIS